MLLPVARIAPGGLPDCLRITAGARWPSPWFRIPWPGVQPVSGSGSILTRITRKKNIGLPGRLRDHCRYRWPSPWFRIPWPGSRPAPVRIHPGSPGQRAAGTRLRDPSLPGSPVRRISAFLAWLAFRPDKFMFI